MREWAKASQGGGNQAYVAWLTRVIGFQKDIAMLILSVAGGRIDTWELFSGVILGK